VKKTTLMKIFLRSFFIHTTLNFRRMQNLGFTMAIIPLIRELQLQQRDSERMLTMHLQLFNTNPYLSASVIGSVVRLEEEQAGKGDDLDIPPIKQSLMGSYAAIGDIFFWGALRPFASIFAVILAYMGLILAPVAFLLIYTPAHFWIRLKGFIEGYRQGKNGFEFIRSLDLPRVAVKIRWLSLTILAGAVVLLSNEGNWPFIKTYGFIMKLMAMAVVLFCFLLIKKGLSQIYIIYGAIVIFFLISWMGLIN
jgi:mannose/fructose/N-acetylgalactosamine-specific phosphotransferase system component IID